MTLAVDSGADAAALLDAADRLILDESADLLAGSVVVIIGSTALAAEALQRGAKSVRVSDDADPTTSALDPNLLGDADVVLLRLPKALSALDGIARLIAASAPPDVVVFAGARLKYMTVGMNEVLKRSFDRLDVSLARQKSRVLIARGPRPVAAPAVARHHDAELDLWVAATGGVFGGPSIDVGTRALLGVFGRLPEYATAIDFGCGTGILAVALKRRRPGARVIATDISADAVRSAIETAAANGSDVEVIRDHLLRAQPDASADLILLNPPFHDGGSLSTDTALAMFSEAGRVLRPGGVLWTVFNSHLGYRHALERAVGPTTQITHNTKFTVTASTSSDRLGPIDPAAK